MLKTFKSVDKNEALVGGKVIIFFQSNFPVDLTIASLWIFTILAVAFIAVSFFDFLFEY